MFEIMFPYLPINIKPVLPVKIIATNVNLYHSLHVS